MSTTEDSLNPRARALIPRKENVWKLIKKLQSAELCNNRVEDGDIIELEVETERERER